MKVLLITFITVVMLPCLCYSQETTDTTDTNTLTVSMVGFESDAGKVYIGLYNEETAWLGTRYKSDIKEISNKTSKAVFENLPNGEYAVSIYHDENDNGTMDANWMGIPSEPYACSRGAKGFMGPPKWKNAVMTIESSTSIIIKL